MMMATAVNNHNNKGTMNNPTLRRSSSSSHAGGGSNQDKAALRSLALLLGFALLILMTQLTQFGSLQQEYRRRNYQLHHRAVVNEHGSLVESVVEFREEEEPRQQLSLLQASLASLRGAEKQGNDDDSPKMQQAKSTITKTKKTQKLPDWRLGMDCSIWDFHCVTLKQSSGLYQEYPFPYGRFYDHQDAFDWESMDHVPLDWQHELAQVNTTLLYPPPRPIEYRYKPRSSQSQYRACLQSAHERSWKDQLTNLIQSKQIDASLNNDLNLLAFTISDYTYAKDMMHEVFEMNNHVVGFPGAFFMVALDNKTLEMACHYNYPVIAWDTATPTTTTTTTSRRQQQIDDNATTTTTTEDQLRASVQNTKLEVSLALLEMEQSFFFYEMDVWFLQSPLPVIKLFEEDMLFSSHQNCPICVNIGVYFVRATAATKEYFQIAIQLAKDSPNTHDQYIMGQILHMQHLGDKSKWEYNPDRWDPLPGYFPTFHTTVKTGFFSPHEIVASERPYASQMAIAIHPLRESPLKDPHGKKMLAKEMGAWYGFNGDDGLIITTEQAAGYYHREGAARRYILLDGHILNGYSTVMNWEFQGDEAGLYHCIENLRWTVAALVALARRTGRILILPPVAKDRGVHFLWTALDLQSVEELGVDYRETTFFNNHKSWIHDDTPFDTVARTAMGDFKKDQTMFAQYYDDSNAQQHGNADADPPVTMTTRAWKFNSTLMDQVDAIDAWWALHTTIPEIDAAEALLVNTHFLNQHYHRPLGGRLRKEFRKMNPDPRTGRGRAEYDIAGTFAKLRWCPEGKHFGVQDEIAGVFKSNDDCYGKGELYK
ncbi:expressed unknown protein [Seminavis robusta]|uniref:Nucleotide-diphospho-sugar transferase domain-containing protein n=1 Tax=Seminavis robusta TaxID=568900 RepID=A0A9N8D5P4_9STRA|nr:expressed unknown protein [Seminavis robusta]|eukprot:Sro11_g008420.1 n/a (824) ;mRNA; f:20808-23279